MKRFSKLMILAIAISSGMMSCSTNAVEDEPTPVNPESETRTLNIRVVSNNFTRGGETSETTDESIKTLYLAFYKGEETTPLYIKEASIGQDNTYSVEIPANMAKMLDKVIAFANITDKNIISGALTRSTVEKVQNDDGSLIMSSAVYFENNSVSNSTPVYYSSIKGNESVGNERIDIYLDRVASKITVNEDNFYATPLDVKNYQNLSMNLLMDIIGWGVTFTDDKTYLMKQLPEGYTSTRRNLETLLSDYAYSLNNWNKPNDKTISWANSFNFNNFSGVDLNTIKLSDANNSFGSSIYAHETTRSTSDLEKKNSKPSIVIVGQYKNGDNALGTFYRLRSNGSDYIYTAEEYFDYLNKDLNFLYVKENNNIVKATTEKLKELLTLSAPSENVTEGNIIPDFLVSPQLKNGQTNTFCDNSGNSYSDDDLNKLLYAYAGLLEMYFNGQCIFVEPIKHYQYDNDILYGIIRNHSYTLNIQSITGFGRGVASNESLISEEDIPEISSSYKVNTTVYVNDWNKQNEQDIDIDNSKK